MNLPFLENPLPPHTTEIWEQLDDTQRAAVLDRLAQLIAKAAETGTQQEGGSHE
jgi:predicted Fe-S protein YdhL (DUF1289 family)